MERRIQIVAPICTLVLAIMFPLLPGCAPVSVHMVPNVRWPATPRSDCPSGMGMTSKGEGMACWPPDEALPNGCMPYRCQDTGYLFWDCSKPEPEPKPEPKPATPHDQKQKPQPRRNSKATAYACALTGIEVLS